MVVGVAEDIGSLPRTFRGRINGEPKDLFTINADGTFTFHYGLDFASDDTTLASLGVTATKEELNLNDNIVATVGIALAAGASNTLVATITLKDAAGNAITGVSHQIEAWISEAATGIGLTADTISGDATWGSNQEFEEIVSKKRFTVQTTVNGVATLSVVDSAKPADQYIAVRHPVTGKIIVSAASGVNWGA